MNNKIETVTTEELQRYMPAQDDESLFCANGVGASRFNSFLVAGENDVEYEWRFHFAEGPFDNNYSNFRLRVPKERWDRFVRDELWHRTFGYTHNYEKVIWQNKMYCFNQTQARLVSQMHSQFLSGVSQQFERNIFLKSNVNLSDYRLDKAFRSQGSMHPLFGKLIVKAEGSRGAYIFNPWPPHTDDPRKLPTSWRPKKENAQKSPPLAV